MLTNISVVKVARKLSYNSKHGQKLGKEHLFRRQLARATGPQGSRQDGRMKAAPDPGPAPRPERRLSAHRQTPVMFKPDEVAYLHPEVVFISSDATMKFHGVPMDYKVLRDPEITGIALNTPDNSAPTSKPSPSPHFTVLGTTRKTIWYFPPPIANHIVLYFKKA